MCVTYTKKNSFTSSIQWRVNIYTTNTCIIMSRHCVSIIRHRYTCITRSTIRLCRYTDTHWRDQIIHVLVVCILTRSYILPVNRQYMRDELISKLYSNIYVNVSMNHCFRPAFNNNLIPISSLFCISLYTCSELSTQCC